MARPLPRRRDLLTLTAMAALQACASVPNVNAYLDPDPLQRHFALQHALADGPLVFGNKTRLLMDGSQALPAMFQAMQQAKDHINLEYFIFEDVAVGSQHLSDLLIAQLNRGVTVNIIYDAYGSRDTPATLFDTLRRAGASVTEFNPINPVAALTGHSPNDRDHRKIMVVDGRIGFVGGINLSRTYDTRPPLAFPPTAIRSTPTGAIPRWKSRVPPSRNCSVCSSTSGSSRRAVRSLRPNTFRSCRARACRPSASSAARQAISSRSITSRWSRRSAWQNGASGCPAVISCRRTRSERIWPRRHGAASISDWWCQATATSKLPCMPREPRTATCWKAAHRSLRCRTPCCIPSSLSWTASGLRSARPISTVAASCSTMRSTRSFSVPTRPRRSRHCCSATWRRPRRSRCTPGGDDRSTSAWMR